MSGFLDTGAVDIPCPGCGHKHHKTIGWIKANDHITCVCGADITLDKSDFIRPIQQVEKSLSDFKRDIGRMFR